MVSSKNQDEGKRSYTLRTRARRLEEVHRRITQATVDLHRTVGPARTTVSEIAKRAGVRRATVYNHFPTDLALMDACSSHWVAEHPPPDPAAWARVAAPTPRLETALAAMYDYYDDGQDMLENVLRDAPLVPALDQVNRRKWWPMVEERVEMLAGWLGASGGAPDTALRASLRVALDFFTWQTLARTGLSNAEAARLAASWVRAAA